MLTLTLNGKNAVRVGKCDKDKSPQTLADTNKEAHSDNIATHTQRESQQQQQRWQQTQQMTF